MREGGRRLPVGAAALALCLLLGGARSMEAAGRLQGKLLTAFQGGGHPRVWA
eukprot:CAMPEP_0206257222 /NCGR_PEP_ID=MMETSP0047_2-20121206/25214_1 /ASSEMBLY_ACC=CAM_ASM_000192 /TAXON_ID=195065 /ORGANISM="Chroomonas mesostigmatica_cf, Strain CCMP1168" /LENGTH=51 /DNA_ID=CAMNT_0053683771 /DNA_START=61 /DNA_END=213 /DNA_ORIENTATION=+